MLKIYSTQNYIIAGAVEMVQWLEHWTLSQRTRDKFPAATWPLIATCTFSSRGFNTLFCPLRAPGSQVWPCL